jgi:non-ribosomal peptide synthetase component F
MNFNIARPFFDAAYKHPQRSVVVADGVTHTYQEMLEAILRTAQWLSSADENPPKRVGILGSRSLEACVGILASAWVGAAYVPINLKQPESRIIGLLERSGLDALVADRYGSRILTAAVLGRAPRRILSFATTHRPARVKASLPLTNCRELTGSTSPS